MFEVVDLLGNAVNVGDRIAAAFRNSTIAFLRVGTVQQFTERGNRLVIKVAWDTESAPGGRRSVSVVGAIEAELYRFIKLDA